MNIQMSEADRQLLIQELGKEKLLKVLAKMLLIRQFETRSEAAYQQGKIGGFFHSYIGQEAIQTAALEAVGPDNWWVTSYRCHALALLLGATPNELMAELYGRATGNAKGRGGSMHFFTERLLGGFGIVGGQVPIATGAAFAAKYQGKNEEIAVCFLGDGAVAQGAFHESLNLAALGGLPCLYVIENNKWGMGTSVKRAISVERLAEDKAIGYGMPGYTYNGMDFYECYAGFKKARAEIITRQTPVLIEVVADRFKGHSVSDPGLYRTKEVLKASMQHDPILLFQQSLIDQQWIDLEGIKRMEKEQKDLVLAAMKYADESPWPTADTLEQDVYAPATKE